MLESKKVSKYLAASFTEYLLDTVVMAPAVCLNKALSCFDRVLVLRIQKVLNMVSQERATTPSGGEWV